VSSQAWQAPGFRDRGKALETKELILNWGLGGKVGDIDLTRMQSYHCLLAEFKSLSAVDLCGPYTLGFAQYGGMRWWSRFAVSLLVVIPTYSAPTSADADDKPGAWLDTPIYVANFNDMHDGQNVEKSGRSDRVIPLELFEPSTGASFLSMLDAFDEAAKTCHSASYESHRRDNNDAARPCPRPLGFDWRANLT
jgi:hypothetical protein